MPTASETNDNCKLCSKLGLRPLTRENVLFYYMPIHSMTSYGVLAINVMNPSIIARFVPKRDITNILLVHTIIGSSLYIYNRPHLKAITSGGKRVAYSVLGSVLFNLGSVLTWAIARSLITKSNNFVTLLGLASGAVIVKLSYDYFEDCDKLVSSKK